MTDLDKAREEYEREHDARAQHRERACDRYIAALEAEVKTVAQSVRKLCGKWDCDDLDELEDKLTALDELDSYSGHLKWMDKHYPLDVPYFAESEDVGCQVMRLSRKVMECEANLAAAEAQVEKLKGQDCASCSHTKQDTALYPPPPPNYEVYSYCGCPDSPCYMRVITPVDRCAHWSARLTAPEPKEES